MLTRLRPGRPEDPQHTQAAVRALVNAGYAPHEAGRAFIQYRTRLREATAAWPSIAIAGFLTTALPALLLLVLQAAPTAGLLCLGGIGLGVIERWRWRRETVHEQFKVQTSDQQYLIHQGALWAVLLAVLAVQQFAQAGAVIGLGIATGLPLSFVFRYYFYRSYPTALAIVSNAPAGAEARRIVETEITDSEAAAVQMPRSAGPVRTAVAQPGMVRQQRRSWVRRQDAAIALGSFAGWWFLARWWVWQGAEEGTSSMAPFSGDIGVDIVGIVGGVPIGLGLAWFYRSFIET